MEDNREKSKKEEDLKKISKDLRKDKAKLKAEDIRSKLTNKIKRLIEKTKKDLGKDELLLKDAGERGDLQARNRVDGRMRRRKIFLKILEFKVKGLETVKDKIKTSAEKEQENLKKIDKTQFDSKVDPSSVVDDDDIIDIDDFSDSNYDDDEDY